MADGFVGYCMVYYQDFKLGISHNGITQEFYRDPPAVMHNKIIKAICPKCDEMFNWGNILNETSAGIRKVVTLWHDSDKSKCNCKVKVSGIAAKYVYERYKIRLMKFFVGAIESYQLLGEPRSKKAYLYKGACNGNT